jgi:acyl-CoA dehydrogenase
MQFGQPIAKFQVTQHKFADMATEVELARALTYHALALYVKGKDANTESSMAKLLATEVRCRVTDEAVQIHGGYGYMMEYPVQRYWRDARIGTIGGGTSEIMNEIIAASLGLGERSLVREGTQLT